MKLLSSTMPVASLLVLAALPAWGGEAKPAPAGIPVAAVWKQTKIEFHYFGRTSRYSCDGLRDKVRALLLDMGARGDMRLRTSGCEIGRISLVGINPGLSIEFSSPAQLGSADKPAAGTDEKSFDARYEPFVLKQDAFRNLNIGDCELIEEFARQVLPKLSVRVVHQDITCVPYQHSGGRYLISGEVLKPVPTPRARN